MIDRNSVAVICTEPNNGYYVMVFTDKGTLVRSQCNLGDMYEGLVHTVSDLLLHYANSITPMPDLKELTPESQTEMDNYVDVLYDVCTAFMKSVQNRMCIESSARQFEAVGLDKGLADMLAYEIHKRSGKPDSEEDEEEDDDNSDIDID